VTAFAKRSKIRWIQARTAEPQRELVVDFARCTIEVPLCHTVFAKWMIVKVKVFRVFPILIVTALCGCSTGPLICCRMGAASPAVIGEIRAGLLTAWPFW
jgi:hypothetical protein